MEGTQFMNLTSFRKNLDGLILIGWIFAGPVSVYKAWLTDLPIACKTLLAFAMAIAILELIQNVVKDPK